MALILLSLGSILLAAMVAVLPVFSPKRASLVSTSLGMLGAVVGLIPCLEVLSGGASRTMEIPWQMPLGSFALNLDSLSAFFLLPIFGLGALTAIFGVPYLRHSVEEKDLGAAWFCFYVLWGSMILVLLAANGLLFLMAWELTVLSSFFLVILDKKDESARRAGWVYLVASHLGTGFLIILFLLMARETGSLAFDGFSRVAALPPTVKGLMFLLAVIGFGTKAGFIPLHVWLPEAHPAAPSHVSALMSGVMIKTGIYGLVRTLFFLGHPAAWWGWTLVGIGLVSGILGVLFALAQHDLKRLLAYHSVENIGIIALGLGLGLLGLSHGNLTVAAFGLAGGLLHVLNHAVFKGLLFLGAGAVLQQTGTRDLDRLGGLLKKMPWTGSSFLVGCLSISGFPPFNGFISEFLIFFGAFLAFLQGGESLIIPGLSIIVGLSLIGGLAAACFAKAFSVVFLGNPRSKRAEEAREVPFFMRVPMVALAALCALIALVSPYFLGTFGEIFRLHPDFTSAGYTGAMLSQAFRPLIGINLSALVLLALLVLVLALRHQLLASRQVGKTITWDCGYAQPSVTMQYTGSSFAQPLTELFRPVLRTESHPRTLSGVFPKTATFLTHTADLFQETLFKPVFRIIAGLFQRITLIQNGVVQVYVLHISITLGFLLLVGLW